MMTPNGKIYSRKRLGLSAREQRMLASAIKRARYMALLPYTSATRGPRPAAPAGATTSIA